MFVICVNNFFKLITREILLRGVDPNLGSKLLDEIIEGSELKLSEVSGCEEAKTALEEVCKLFT